MNKNLSLISIIIIVTCITRPIIAQETYSDSLEYEYVYDTIYEYDTLFLETRISDTNTQQITKDNKKKTAEWYVGAHIAITQDINQPKSDIVEESVFGEICTNGLGYELSGFVKYKNLQWTVAAGVGVTCYREEIEAKPTNLVISANPYQQMDTISSYYTENGDGSNTWHYITRYNTYFTYDSTFENTPYVNKTWLFDIPLMVGYRIALKNKMLNVETGLISGFYLKNSSEKLGVSEDGNLHYIDKNYYQSFQLAFSLAVTIDIPLSEKLIFQPGLYYRYQVTSIYTSNYLYSYKPASLGVYCKFIYLF